MRKGKLRRLREEYHRRICADILGYRKLKRAGQRFISIADVDNAASADIAERLAKNLNHPLADQPKEAQAAGSTFTRYTKDYLEQAFRSLTHLRPGRWELSDSQKKPGIASYEQYEHLAEIEKVLLDHGNLRAALGGDYLITPDIVVARHALTDAEINEGRTGIVIGTAEEIARLTPLRARETGSKLLLHASVSCKWTIRSDRAQNTRTEALNLIRNRKGRVPHIVAVTMEPLPSRLASIAMGTGDVDCTYHAALHELRDSVQASGHADALEMLAMLIEGRRLRDISDLPFDLAI